MKKILSLLTLFSLISNLCFAENKNELVTTESKVEEEARYILENMHQDYITCYSFYKIGSEYIKKTNGDPAIIKGVEDSYDTSLKLVHETGEMISMTNHEMSSKIKSEIKNQLNLIDNNFNNSSILLKKYARVCKNLIEDKAQRIFFWEKQALEKFK